MNPNQTPLQQEHTPMQPEPSQTWPEQAQNSSSGKGFLLLGAVALLVVIGSMLYYIMTPKSSPLTSPPTQALNTPSPQQVVQLSEEEELKKLDTGDPSLDLEDLEKELQDL